MRPRFFRRRKKSDKVDSAIPPTPEQCPLAATISGRYEVALIEARRGFDGQTEQFSKIRSSAGSLVGYAGVSSSVLIIGSETPVSGDCFLVAASLTFTVLIGLSIWAIAPTKLVPGAGSSKIVEAIEAGMDGDSVAKQLALDYSSAYEANGRKLHIRTLVVMAALGAFAATVILLTVRLLIGI